MQSNRNVIQTIMKFRFPGSCIEKSKTKLVKFILTYFIKPNAFKISIEHVISIKNGEIFCIILFVQSLGNPMFSYSIVQFRIAMF